MLTKAQALPLTEIYAQSHRRSRLQGPEWGGGICVWAECEPREQPIRNVGAPLFCFPNPKMTVKTLEGAAPRDVNKTLQVEGIWCVRQPGQAGRGLPIPAHFPFVLISAAREIPESLTSALTIQRCSSWRFDTLAPLPFPKWLIINEFSEYIISIYF